MFVVRVRAVAPKLGRLGVSEAEMRGLRAKGVL